MGSNIKCVKHKSPLLCKFPDSEATLTLQCLLSFTLQS